MMKYEAPVVEMEIFAVENVMDAYVTEDDGELGENDLPID